MKSAQLPIGDDGARVPRFAAWAGGAIVVLLLSIYFNTGSLTPMALTGGCIVQPTTGYVQNSDVQLHLAMTEWMLGRVPGSQVDMMVGRRALWHVLMLPFHLTLSWETAAFVLNMLAHFFAALVFAWQGRKVYGDRMTLWILWLLSTFPPVGYLGGLAMHYGFIIPAMLMILLIFAHLDRSVGAGRLLLLNLLLGLLGFAYDFAPFTAPAMAIMLVVWGRFRWVVPALVLQVLPVTLWILVLQTVNAKAIDNGNTRVLINPIIAWIQHFDLGALWASLKLAPRLIWKTYLYTGYTALPLLAALLWGWALLARRSRVMLKDHVFLLVGLAIMIFVCLTPRIPQAEQTGWMFQGGLIVSCARLFLPICLSLLLLCGRVLGGGDSGPPLVRRIAQTAAVACIGFNAVVSLGMFVPSLLPYAKDRHVEFYALHRADWIEPRLDHLGRRPFGFERPISTLAPIEAADPVAARYMRLEDSLVKLRAGYELRQRRDGS